MPALVVAVLAPWTASATEFEAVEICQDCSVTALSEDGSSAVGRMSAYGDYPEPFLWTAGVGLQRLGRRPDLPGYVDHAPAVSANGRVVAALISSLVSPYAVMGRWTATQGWQELGPIPGNAVVVNGAVAAPLGLSPDGRVVVGTYSRESDTGGTDTAARWDRQRGLVDLGPETFGSRIHGASRGGQVLAGVAQMPPSLLDRAAVWNSVGQRQWLGPDHVPSRAVAINAEGTHVAGAQGSLLTGEYGGMLWRRDGLRWIGRSLGAPAGWRGPSLATGLSADGSVVVGQGSRYSDWFGCYGCQGGWVWTEATGNVSAHDFFGGIGLGVDRNYRISTVAAVSADGQVFAVIARHVDGEAPDFRSFLVRRKAVSRRQ